MPKSGRKWFAIAERMAVQLAAHADCEVHSEARDDPACPSCQDRAAYKLWLAAGGHDFRLFAGDNHLADKPATFNPLENSR